MDAHLLPTPANFPELRAAADRFFETVRKAKAMGLDRTSLRLAIKRAESDYMRVFGEVVKRGSP
jgi:hypothetical protein